MLVGVIDEEILAVKAKGEWHVINLDTKIVFKVDHETVLASVSEFRKAKSFGQLIEHVVTQITK